MARFMRLIAKAAPVKTAPTPVYSFTEFTGMEYLQIDLANHFGLGKEDYPVRIQWALDMQDAVLAMLDDVEANIHSALLHEAEEPAMFFSAALALRNALEGKPVKHLISFDAAASGLQILAALTGCRKSAELCGLVPTGHRADAYTTCYGAMCKASGTSATIERKDVKYAVMTSLYQSKAVPKRVFGEGELLQCFYRTIEDLAPGAWELNNELTSLWNENGLRHSWILPDNFHVHVKVKEKRTETATFDGRQVEVSYFENAPSTYSRSLSPNIVHSCDGYVVREMARRCMFDREQVIRVAQFAREALRHGTTSMGVATRNQEDRALKALLEREERSGMLSARILDLITSYNVVMLSEIQLNKLLSLIKSLPKKPFTVLSNHDAWRFLPNYGNDLRRQYNQIMSEIAASSLLEDIANQLLEPQGRGPITVEKKGDIADLILQADYALC